MEKFKILLISTVVMLTTTNYSIPVEEEVIIENNEISDLEQLNLDLNQEIIKYQLLTQKVDSLNTLKLK